MTKTRIHLTIMQPQGYIHSQGFLDQARYARYQFRSLGAEVTIGKNRLRDDAVNIVFGAHLGFSPEFKERYTCVFFNLEQLGEGGARVCLEYTRLLSTSAVIDYDEKNLAAYGCKPGDVPVVTFLYAPYLAPEQLIPLDDRPIDLLFFGSMNERRKALIARIEACGWNVSTFDKPLYGEERDQFIRQSKAILNCHFYETSRFEQARAFHSLSLGTPVVSERTCNTSPPAAYEDAVSWFADESLEAFFSSEFMTASWISRVSAKLEGFSSSVVSETWRTAFGFCEAMSRMDSGTGRHSRLPARMNVITAAGDGYRLGWLNVSKSISDQPDLVADLSVDTGLHMQALDLKGEHRLVPQESLEDIFIRIRVSELSKLPTFIKNASGLLQVNGSMELVLPFVYSMTDAAELSELLGAQDWWVVINEFWRMGGVGTKLELKDVKFQDRRGGACEISEATWVRLKLIKVETSLFERSMARMYSPDFGGIPDDVFEEWV